jgi:HEAT repeat protein
LVDDVDRVARPEDLVLGGLPDALDPWISRLSAKELSAVFFTLSRARVGEDNLRRNVVPLLASSDPERRSAAFRALGEPRNTWAVDLLLPYLRDADARVVRAAADALASIGDARAIEPLLELLRSHASPDHVDAAAGALSNITGVKWDGAHDAAWWDAWWAKNRERFQAPR